jgi:hypothetical protein
MYVGEDLDVFEPIFKNESSLAGEEGTQAFFEIFYDLLHFLRVHGSHQLFIWSTDDFNDQPLSWDSPDFEPSEKSFIEEKPLSDLALDSYWSERYNSLQESYNTLFLQHFDLMNTVYSDDEEKIREIREALEEHLNKQGSTYNGYGPGVLVKE